MGLFSRSKDFQGIMYGSAAMTYGQAGQAIQHMGITSRNDSEWLVLCLREAIARTSWAVESADHVLSLYDLHFPQGSISEDHPFFPTEEPLPGTEDAMDNLCGLLNMRFNQPISRNDALAFSRAAVLAMARQTPNVLSPDCADACGVVIGLAMKTIQEDTMTSRRREREQRLLMGGVIGAWFAGKALQR